jgi:hypothetical protein
VRGSLVKGEAAGRLNTSPYVEKCWPDGSQGRAMVQPTTYGLYSNAPRYSSVQPAGFSTRFGGNTQTAASARRAPSTAGSHCSQYDAPASSSASGTGRLDSEGYASMQFGSYSQA